MKNIEIIGRNTLSGALRIQGAKNSVLPILAGTLLCKGETTINDCPDLSDVHSAFEILQTLGCDVEFSQNTAKINAENINCCEIPDVLMQKMRSSVMFLGAIISRCGEAQISSPGGCDLGPRPIDIHIKAFRELGVQIEENEHHIWCKLNSGKISGGNVRLAIPSVGATENIMLLAALGDGVTTISNAAKEPEIVDLQNFLNSMGANISGAGTSEIIINGVSELSNTTYTVIPDRIVAATYLCLVASCGGEVVLTNVIPEHLETVIETLRKAGCYINQTKNAVGIMRDQRLKAVEGIATYPYPEFPTDAQALVMATMSTAQGTTIFIENLFANRFRHATELNKMNADIKLFQNVAVVNGVKQLNGETVAASDLRGGAALVIAAATAKGKTIITNPEHIYRGYENLEQNLTRLGVNIKQA